MINTDDFKLEVASVIDDPIAKSEILNDKIDIGKYLKENAFKGIDSKVILECLNSNDYNYLSMLAMKQEKLKILYQQYLEKYETRKMYQKRRLTKSNWS